MPHTTPALPPEITVLERGWLSANNVLFLGRDATALVDSGYCANAGQTVALVESCLGGRPLDLLLNTHLHSDHCGGNAALQARWPALQTLIPPGQWAQVQDWDPVALSYQPTGQDCPRFRADARLMPGSEVRLGDRTWQVHAAPGHDSHAVLLFEPASGLLISGDALWENGFGVIFPELLGEADGLASTRATLEMLSRLPLDVVIPGHGSPFAAVDAVFERAFRRVDSFSADIDKLAWHAIKVIVSFAMLEKRRLPAADFPAFLLALPFAVDVNRRYVGLSEDQLAARIERELLLVNALRREDGFLVAG